jgi:hypothetical protein
LIFFLIYGECSSNTKHWGAVIYSGIIKFNQLDKNRFFLLFSAAAGLITLLCSCAMIQGKNLPQDFGSAGKIVSIAEYKAEEDQGLVLYKNRKTRKLVKDFYAGITGSAEIAEIIIKAAVRENIPLPLAFSLAWAESNFSPTAVNQNPYSVDRGLFQLNSRSFPDMEEEDFFDPEINALRGLKYLRYCLDAAGSEAVAVAIYNAGRSRVENRGIPQMTQKHIARVMAFKALITEGFSSELASRGLLELSGENTVIIAALTEKKTAGSL